jgi:hypothetical protein
LAKQRGGMFAGYKKKQYYQMFMALVLVGETCENPHNPNQLRIPPLKNGSQSERYDSVTGASGSQIIVYDNRRAYPGFLITYSCEKNVHAFNPKLLGGVYYGQRPFRFRKLLSKLS